MFDSPFPFRKYVTGPLSANRKAKQALEKLDIEKKDVDLIIKDGIDIPGSSYLKYLGPYPGAIVDTYYGHIVGFVDDGSIGKGEILMSSHHRECPWTGYGIAAKNRITRGLEPTEYENTPWGKLPIFVADSQEQFSKIIRRTQIKFKPNKSRIRLIFRGQTKDWRLNRSDTTYKLIYPNSHSPVVESNLLPTILRSVKYIKNEEQLRNIYFSTTYPISDTDTVRYHYPVRVTRGEIKHRVCLTFQHYGISTDCHLDVSYDPEIALWFATHQIVTNDDGVTQSSVLHYNSGLVEDWPVVFLMIGYELDNLLSTHDIEEMGKSEIYASDSPWGEAGAVKRFEGGPVSLRAKRQKCGLLFGSKFHMKNCYYSDVFAKIYLSPGFRYDGDHECHELFPGPNEDSLLAFLIEEGFYPFRPEIL